LDAVRLLTPLALGAVFACPGVAAARTPQPLVKIAPLTTQFTDRVIGKGPVRAHAASAARAYAGPDGTSILVRFSTAYTENPTVAQTYVDYLSSIPHGSELSKLSLFLAPPSEVQADCGGQDGTLACYDSQTHEMVVPGEQIQSTEGVSTSYVITHEYGHHIAAFRSNAPFPALDWGPKYWSSYEKVCDRTLAGRLAPGDEALDYLRNPGENWAETYARLVYPNEPWRFTSLLKPDAGAFAAARRDVLTPWSAPAVRTFSGTFTRTGGNARRFAFPLTLDGALKVKLHGPSRARYDIAVSTLGQTRGHTTGHAARDSLAWSAACREVRDEQVTVTVSRRTGAGPFKLDVTYAG
jgi:hypothetical protein